ncbi:ABC transporter ATP-binding protein, partial [Ectothiorhodospira lacustris]|uniref:ABC transporter ATP-binding protein n=1 Tax=Ectothiorhodospira lacustris TaxID=2899127 RepID=UPI001EE7B662
MSGLTLENVSFSYGQDTVLDRINLNIRSGEFLVLLGPSGSGKSTLLRLLAGLEAPAKGRVLQEGVPVTRAGRDRAVVFQDYSLFPWLTLTDNVALAVAKGQPQLGKADRLAVARALLVDVGLEIAAGRCPFEVSGGMRQRAAIARALALEASVLLLDEPFGALDPINRIRLQDLLREIRLRRPRVPTTVFVTHDLDEALWLGQRVALLGACPGHLIGEYPVPAEDRSSRDVFRRQPAVQALR